MQTFINEADKVIYNKISQYYGMTLVIVFCVDIIKETTSNACNETVTWIDEIIINYL